MAAEVGGRCKKRRPRDVCSTRACDTQAPIGTRAREQKCTCTLAQTHVHTHISKCKGTKPYYSSSHLHSHSHSHSPRRHGRRRSSGRRYWRGRWRTEARSRQGAGLCDQVQANRTPGLLKLLISTAAAPISDGRRRGTISTSFRSSCNGRLQQRAADGEERGSRGAFAAHMCVIRARICMCMRVTKARTRKHTGTLTGAGTHAHTDAGTDAGTGTHIHTRTC